jgi:hypothetical protein
MKFFTDCSRCGASDHTHYDCDDVHKDLADFGAPRAWDDDTWEEEALEARREEAQECRDLCDHGD